MKKLLVACLLFFGFVPLEAQGPAIVLQWDPSPTANISGYFIYRNLTPGNWTGGNWVKMNPSGPTTALTFTDTSVQRGVVYYYVVTAYRGPDDTESDPSNEVSAIVLNPPPAPATNLKVLQVIP